MSDSTRSESASWRQRGYYDALAGRPKSQGVPAEHRPVYVSGYRRGDQERKRMMSQ